VSKDHDTGIQNMGGYRTMVCDETRVAGVISAPPAVHLSSVALLPYGVDEITLAEGAMGVPINLVKAKTVNLLMPADAEIIIEGEIHPGEMTSEGPFGEFTGTMGPGYPALAKKVGRLVDASAFFLSATQGGHDEGTGVLEGNRLAGIRDPETRQIVHRSLLTTSQPNYC